MGFTCVWLLKRKENENEFHINVRTVFTCIVLKYYI